MTDRTKKAALAERDAEKRAAQKQAEERAAGYEKALRTYGRHLYGCTSYNTGPFCTCGLSEAIALASQPADERGEERKK